MSMTEEEEEDGKSRMVARILIYLYICHYCGGPIKDKKARRVGVM